MNAGPWQEEDPPVAEAEIDGGADAVLIIIADSGRRPEPGHNKDGIYTAPMDHSYRAALAGNGNNGHKGGGGSGQDLRRITRSPNRNRCRWARKTPTRASLPSSKICFSWQRFRRRRASST